MLVDRIEVKSNVRLVARERGKIIAVREAHNIFLDVGREWMTRLTSYATLPAAGVAPGVDDPAENYRLRYMGFGIGSTSQIFPSGLFTAAPLDDYGATFEQSGDDPEVFRLETPVAIGATVDPAPNDRIWLGQLATPPTYPAVGQVRYSRILTAGEVTYGPFAMVPISEVALFTAAAAYNVMPVDAGAMVFYHSFTPMPKTNAADIEVLWTLRY